MAERHITDEEIRGASHSAPRFPKGIPQAFCLNCGQQHEAFYACQSHDCRVNLAEHAPYSTWLLRFQKLGYGTLVTAAARKFPFDKVISGRQALTFHLQSDLDLGGERVLASRFYSSFPEFPDYDYAAVQV